MRTLIKNTIQAIQPLDSQEKYDIDRTVAWIDSGANLFRTAKPATPPMHLVSYFVLVDGDHILLVDHINAELWLPTGGHVDPGEDPRQTVRREAWEELGIKHAAVPEQPLFLTVTKTVGKTAGHVDVSLWYVLEIKRTTPLEFDPKEFHQIHWFQKDQIPLNRSDPHIQRFLEKHYQA